MTNIVTVKIFARRMVNSDNYNMDCELQSQCANMTSASILTIIHDGKRLTLTPPCYQNRPKSGKSMKESKILDPCVASVETEGWEYCFKQTGSNDKFVTYKGRVDLNKNTSKVTS